MFVRYTFVNWHLFATLIVRKWSLAANIWSHAASDFSFVLVCRGQRGHKTDIHVFCGGRYGFSILFISCHSPSNHLILLLAFSVVSYYSLFSTQLYQESYFNSPGEKKKKENLCSLMTCSQCITTQTLCPSSSDVMLSGFWKCSLPLVFVTSFPCGCGRARNGGGEVSANSVPEDLFL